MEAEVGTLKSSKVLIPQRDINTFNSYYTFLHRNVQEGVYHSAAARTAHVA